MKHLVLGLVLLTSCVINTGAKTNRDVDDVGRAFHNTVQIQNAAGDIFCSGVIADRKVLTAWHCADDPTISIFVETVDGRWRAALLTADPINDLAVLIPADKQILPRGVRLARKAPTWADDIWVIGHALGDYDYTVTKGIVSHPRREEGLFSGIWMQHDAGQIGGNSGGPVLNKRGRLVGIVSFGVIVQSPCGGLCLGQVYQFTHVKGAVHYEPVRDILSGL